MLEWLIALLVSGLGSGNWTVRVHCQNALHLLTDLTDALGPVKEGLRSPDPEVRRRCRWVVERYYSVELPEGLPLYHFDHRVDPALYGRANRLWIGEDSREFVRLLMVEKGMTRSEVRRLVEAAVRRWEQARQRLAPAPSWRPWP